jgi:AcrR family transcriptional regulator
VAMKEEATKRLNREDRREQIIQAALLVFIEKGFSSTTTSEIAKAAGISEVTLFRNFSSKREIFYAGIEPILLKAMDNDTLSDKSPIGSKQIEQIIFSRIKFLEENRGIVKLILNENMLNQNDENYIHKMVIGLKDQLDKSHILRDDEFTIRLLMGSFLSFLYLPESNENLVEEYSRRISELIMKRHN